MTLYDPKNVREWTEPYTGMKFIRIPEGRFQMGSPPDEAGRYSDEEQHEVCIDEFWIGQIPVTQAQWKKIRGWNYSEFKLGPNYPVESISWYDIQTFIRLLQAKTTLRFRLPYEAEWEYACRAGTETPFYFGESITAELANFNNKKTTETGTFPPNKFSLYDMHGNVWEYCHDYYDENYYAVSPLKNPKGPKIDGLDRFHVVRGGGYDSFAEECRSASRSCVLENVNTGPYGFRLVLLSVLT